MEIKLKLKIKDVEIELSEKDAVDLRDALKRLTGDEMKVIRDWYPLYIDRYVRPYWDTHPWQPYTVYCNNICPDGASSSSQSLEFTNG
jgi:hypothetical protein